MQGIPERGELFRINGVITNVEGLDSKREARRLLARNDRARPTAVRSISFTGIVRHKRTARPIGGVLVRAYLASPQPTLLGETMSARDGRFLLPIDERFEREFSLLQERPAGSVVLQAESERGDIYAVSTPRSPLTSAHVVLEIALPNIDVPHDVWERLAEVLESTRVVQLHELANGLAGSDTSWLSAEWTLELRHAALAKLEESFLDPAGILARVGESHTFHSLRATGGPRALSRRLGRRLDDPLVATAVKELVAKFASFSDLLHVDWIIDTNEVKSGKLGPATTKFQDAYLQESGLGAGAGSGVPKGPPDKELIGYRNYLRAIFTGPASDPDFHIWRDQLHRRFHQSFTTSNTTAAPANSVVIPIVRNILTATIGEEYGFGVEASEIPDQGELTDRAYLDELVSLSGLSQEEFARRYRIRLDRPDSAKTSPVTENIWALQRFYSDGFQSVADPFPIIPPSPLGRAPFFLQYDEWLARTRPFFGENYHVLRTSFGIDGDTNMKHFALTEGGLESETPLDDAFDLEYTYPLRRWFAGLILLEQLLDDAHAAFANGEFGIALNRYTDALAHASSAVLAGMRLKETQPNNAEGSWITTNDSVFPSDVLELVDEPLQQLLALPITNADELAEFERFTRTRVSIDESYGPWLKGERPRLMLMLARLMAHVLPVCLAEVALAVGDYESALTWFGRTTGFPVGVARLDDNAGYWSNSPWKATGVHPSGSLYQHGALPYTADVSAVPIFDTSRGPGAGVDWYEDLSQAFVKEERVHPVELAYFRLRHAGAMLDWADALYRTDEPGNIARARELYKAALWIHGANPGYSPQWTSSSFEIAAPFLYSNHTANAALTSQKARARKALAQIEAGLNWYGAGDALVPSLRYRTLKDAADRFAAAARSVEIDFLAATTKVEEALREGLLNSNMLKKAAILAKIADEQAAIAKVGVQIAQSQVAAIEAQIQAKKDEIADHDDFGEQLIDWFGGVKDALTDLPEWVTKDLGKGAAGEAGLAAGSTETGFFGQGGWLGMGAGWSAAGYGILVYAGISGLVSVGEAQNQRMSDLSTLEDKALPLALAQLQAKQHEVAIAGLNHQLAEADGELALSLIRFDRERLLNVEFWAQVAGVLKRIMRRYLELAGRHAWLAERALAYEQDRPIDVVRFDYFPEKLSGATGAELLELDLAELEAGRLESTRHAIPIKQTFSLAFDFPLAFAKLKLNGRCSFMTSEVPFRTAHPGTYGLRIKALSAAAQTVQPIGSARGLLRNVGYSSVSQANGTSHLSYRYPDALPLTEFNLRADMGVFGFPDETLLTFEGSGVETMWELELPAASNPYGLEALADILLTFDVRAQWSAELYETEVAATPASVERALLVSTLHRDPLRMKAFNEEGVSVAVPFDLAALQLPTN
jgi:hypothetical protein